MAIAAQVTGSAPSARFAFMFEPWLTRWSLAADGDPIVTASSRLLPVRRNGGAAMLKIVAVEEEQRGGRQMEWWSGDRAAMVLARDGEALLLERAEGGRSLAALSKNGRDDEASEIACAVAARLHAPRAAALPALMPLDTWFAALAPSARRQGGFLARSAAMADKLLRAPQQISVLHGDIHHDNILDFGARGWLAIDPKGLIGERGFDFANLFCNPDMASPAAAFVRSPDIFARRLGIISSQAGIDRTRLLQWIIAYTGLSSAWLIADGIDPEAGLAIGALAEAALAA
jgi:streptomycin 6-kinase